MPPRTRSSDPGPEPPVMTWMKATPTLAVTSVFDSLRFMFEWFWVFGAALGGTVVGVWLSNWLPSSAATLVGGGVAGVTGFFAGAALEAFGVVMAMAVGFLGWLTMGILLLITNHRIFKANATAGLWMLASLMVAETPFIGSIPSLTLTTWRLHHTQIKKEKAAHKAWKAAYDRAMQEGRAQTAADVAVRRQAAANEIPADVRRAA